jgi:hypothetical protein
MAGPGVAVEARRGAADADGGGEARRVHHLRCGRIDQVAALRRQQAGVGVLLPGVGVEVLGRSELLRVDEDRADHPLGLRLGQPDQRQVAFVQRPHGRHQGDPLAPLAPGLHAGPERRDGADDR